MSKKILIVEDDQDIAKSMQLLLQKNGYEADIKFDGQEALSAMQQQKYAVVILDIMLPKMNGLSVLTRVRQEKNNISIILVSAKSEISDKVVGLELGADDYITKPFDFAELLARIQTQLRRYEYVEIQKKQLMDGNSLTVGDLRLNLETKILKIYTQSITLTATEFAILALLMHHPSRVFSSREIYEKIWQEEAFGSEQVVMTHIRRIREKIEINPKQPKYLKVVWGLGYKIGK